MQQRIAVIGAGLSGIATLKELLEEGHDVTCFEKLDDIGGVFSDMGTYDSVKLTVSNYFMAYSDFMPYEDKVRFWTRAEYKTYLDRYAEHFELRPHIKFNSTLVAMDNLDEGVSVTIENAEGEQLTETFDRLAICSGQFQEPNIPMVDGFDKFPGAVMHSSKYRNPEQLDDFKGKRVLCLGMGESAADVVTEVAEIAASTTLSLRRNHLFAERMVNSMPIDVQQNRHWHSLPAKMKSDNVRNIWRRVMAQTDKSEPIYHMAEHVVNATDEPGSVVTKTERIFEAVANGMTIDIGGIKEFQGAKVIFNSGREEEFDAIMLCTGFKFSLPFLSKHVEIKDIRDCYLQAFHPELQDKIALIGFVRPQQGGVPLMAEMQARYFARLCSGKCQLPKNIANLAQNDKSRWQQEFYETPHVFGLVNGLRFNEKLAKLIGCAPPQPNPVLSPNAFFKYWFHHIWPSQYRLVGPGSRQEARKHWKEAPTHLASGGKLTIGKKLNLLYGLFVCRIKSFFTSDEKSKWRTTKMS